MLVHKLLEQSEGSKSAEERSTGTVLALKPGVTLAIDHNSRAPTTALGIRIGFGSAYEEVGERGASHLLEHMAFKRTQMRNAEELAAAMDDMGGAFEAETGQEHIMYSAHVTPDDAGRALDLLCEIANAPHFDPVELAVEKDVIAAEMLQYDDDAASFLFEQMTVKAFGTTGIGAPVLGDPDDMQALDSQALSRFWRDRVLPSPVVIAATGNVDVDAIVTHVDRLFEARDAAASKKTSPFLWQASREQFKCDAAQAQVLFGLPGRGMCDPDHLQVHVIANILGRGMTARLVRRLREEMGACYTIYAFHTPYSQTGLFGIHAVTGAERIDEVERGIMQVLAELPDTLSEEEVRQACHRMRIGLRLALSAPQAQLERLSRETMLYGRLQSIKEIEEKIMSFDSRSIKLMFQGMLASGPIVISSC